MQTLKTLLTCLSKNSDRDETKWIMKGVGGCKVLGKGQLRSGYTRNDKDFTVYSECDWKTLENFFSNVGK